MAKQTGTTWGTPRASAVARWATRLASRKRRWRSESIVGSVGWQDFALIHAGPLPLCRRARLVADKGEQSHADRFRLADTRRAGIARDDRASRHRGRGHGLELPDDEGSHRHPQGYRGPLSLLVSRRISLGRKGRLVRAADLRRLR